MTDESDSEEGQQTPSALPVKRIRSAVRRRILERLSEGRATVTQIATSTNLRPPHTSAELKRLRREELVFSDEETGSRGACLALTARGWDTLRVDEIARIQELNVETPPEDALGRLISVSGNHLLIAFVRRPNDGPIALPNRPLDTTRTGSTEDVWTWIEPRERKPRWVSSETFLPVSSPPLEIDSSNISSWSAESQIWGLQRFRLIDESKPLQLASGSWFGQLADSTLGALPNHIPREEGWRLGSLSLEGPVIRMDAPLLALGLDRMSRETLLTAASGDAITLAPNPNNDIHPRSIPFEVLDAWVEIAHPRLKPTERMERLRVLREALSESATPGARRKVDDATWKRFRKHWGDTSWSSTPLKNGDWIDTSTLSNQAEKSLIEWALQQSTSALVFEARLSSQAVLQTTRFPNHVRLIISPDWKNPPLSNRIQPHPVLPSMWSSLTLIEGLTIPVNLAPAVSTEALSDEIIWSAPLRASEVESTKLRLGGRPEGSLIPNLSVDESEERLLRAAVLSYPLGDSEWANRMENQHPLVAWIASTPSDRWPRWERIGEALGDEWIDLMKSDDIPNEALSKAIIQAPTEWRHQLIEEIRIRIRDNPELAHNLRQSSESTPPKEAAWVAHILLSEVAWLTSELQADLAIWGVDRFLEDPPARCAAVISGLDWLANQYPERMQSESEDWRVNARSTGFSKPQDHDLHLWAILDDWYETGNRPHSSVMALIVERLPEEWWAPVAEIILTALSDDSESIPFISQMDIAWPALILRPIGEPHQIPGDSSTQHGGVRRTLLARLERLTEHNQWTEELPGSLMIRDLGDALRASRDLAPPSFGRTHPMVGWLAIPLHRWPPAEVIQTTEGDARITARLAKLSSGWHTELSRNPMDF
mgnify:CR=1 FL=1